MSVRLRFGEAVGDHSFAQRTPAQTAIEQADYERNNVGLFAGTKWDLPPTCERCSKALSECDCPPPEPAPRQWQPPEKQLARVRVEQRKAKRTVTVVAGLSADASDLPELLTRLKSACGAGGSREGDDLVLQGDHRQRVAELLRNIGYRVRT